MMLDSLAQGPNPKPPAQPNRQPITRRDWLARLPAQLLALGWVPTVALEGTQRMATQPVRHVLSLPPSEANPRNSEGSFLWLADGRLLFGYTHYTGGDADEAPAHLAARVSADGGETWSAEDLMLLENEGAANVMSVSFLRLDSGEAALFYLRKNGWDDCQAYIRILEEERSDFGPSGHIALGPPVLATAREGYFVVNNDRVVQLSSGRIVVPAAMHPYAEGRWSARGVSMAFVSDDRGRSWRQSTTELHAPADSRSGLQEPGVVELHDGRLMMLMRTDLGCQYRSWSDDGGETWSPAEPTDIISPLSPASVKRIPATGDLLMVYNDHRSIPQGLKGRRTPLTAAVSRDEGATWELAKTLEDDPDGWYCYTAITFTERAAILGYCAGNRLTGGLNLLRVTKVDLDWLYA